MISFVTCIKLMGAYVNFDVYLCRYLDSLLACRVPYEVVVVEEHDSRTLRRIQFTPEYLASRRVRLIRYEADYPNPHGFNMIEAYAKNVGLRAAKHAFVCITNCDIFFKADFFQWLPSIRPNLFYRFIMYDGITCLNPDLLKVKTLVTASMKSGDIMLMDKATWLKIGGFPETPIWYHSDFIVCIVAHNNKIPLVVPPVRVYTTAHDRDSVDLEATLDDITCPYLSLMTTNPTGRDSTTTAAASSAESGLF